MLTKEEILEVTKDIISFGVYDDDVDAYLRYIRPLALGSIVVDFGTGRSKNVIRMALSNPEAVIFTFDNAQESMDLSTVGYFKEICNRIKKAGANNIYFTLGDSRTIFPDWDLPISVLNIDSSHQYEPTLEEFKIWEPRVISNGYILLHDYGLVGNDKVEGLQKATDEYFRNDRFEFLENIGNTQVVWKKK
jgi:hypothetical protein